MFGDMGKIGGSATLPHLYQEAVSGENTALIHVGDFAYDLNDDGGKVCDYHWYTYTSFDRLNLDMFTPFGPLSYYWDDPARLLACGHQACSCICAAWWV